jgi:hypothetical protein
MAERSTSSALTAGEEMNRADVTELHYITAIANVPSILQHGILSHTLADQLAHDSVAMAEIQERRKNKQIPGAGRLHDYANLYFDAHNPMLSRCRGRNDEICVLRVEHTVLDLPGVILSTQNAASDWASFWPVENGLTLIERDRVYARFWTHPNDQIEEWRHKSEKCAEVLVPERVDPALVIGAYVANRTAVAAFQAVAPTFSVAIRADMFF